LSIEQNSPAENDLTGSRLSYGWVIVAVSTLMMAVTYGLMYSYSVFFKPLADHFGWDRASISAIYSASFIIRGAVSIGIGWLADRFGSTRIMVFCGVLTGLGLALSSLVNSLWQLFITYAVIEAIGLSATFGVVTSLTSRWFIKNRGLALGIVSSGVGLGTLFVVPGAERLINASDLPSAFVIYGIAGGLIMVISPLFLHRKPPVAVRPGEKAPAAALSGTTLGQAARSPLMWILMAAFGTFFFCNQLVMVHLVNHATDLGITPLTAATFVSIIGLAGIAGRLTTGVGSDKLGIQNTMIVTRAVLMVSFVILIFAAPVWSFYLFAVVFGFTYGGEIPQIPIALANYFGIRSLAALVGMVLFVGNILGAIGPLVGGKVFDIFGDYQLAFIAGLISSVCSLIFAVIIRRKRAKTV